MNTSHNATHWESMLLIFDLLTLFHALVTTRVSIDLMYHQREQKTKNIYAPVQVSHFPPVSLSASQYLQYFLMESVGCICKRQPIRYTHSGGNLGTSVLLSVWFSWGYKMVHLKALEQKKRITRKTDSVFSKSEFSF